MDIDITTNDEMLQPFLSANSDTRLKNIISTIQAEQNKIINESPSDEGPCSDGNCSFSSYEIN